MSAWQVPGPDPFLHEEWAQTYSDVMAPHGADTYHADQARAHRWMLARAAAHRMRSNAGDLADAVTDLALTDAQRRELVVEAMRTRHTLARLVADLENLHPTDAQKERQ